MLLIVEEPGFRIVQYSANAAGFLGLAPLDWHNHTLDRLLGEDNIRTLQAALQGKSLDQVYLYLFTLSSPLHPERSFHLFANRSDGLLLLELERADAVSDPGTHAEWHMFHNALRCLKQSGRLPAFLEQVTTMIKTFTGFERVMVYQFKPDLSGHVIAEALEPGLEPYLNLHFPVGDIPLPARQMLQLVHFRFVPDIDYEPVPLLPDFTTAGLERPVDLGFSGLRSASIMCRLYKQNMNTRSTLVIPLLINGKLWV